MRVIERNICGAFLRREAKSQGNTCSTGTKLLLYRNCIAEWRGNVLWVSTAHRASLTTKSRLRALGVSMCHHKNKLYLNGGKWDGDWRPATIKGGLRIVEIQDTSEECGMLWDAFCNGQDNAMALHDALLEAGRPDLAQAFVSDGPNAIGLPTP